MTSRKIFILSLIGRVEMHENFFLKLFQHWREILLLLSSRIFSQQIIIKKKERNTEPTFFFKSIFIIVFNTLKNDINDIHLKRYKRYPYNFFE